MRKLFLTLLCCVLLVTSCFASNISNMQASSTLNTDGSCQISLTATIVLSENHSTLLFPLGRNVSGVTLNGASARTETNDGIVSVRLANLAAGTLTVNIHYTQSQLVTMDPLGHPLLQLPLLSGFLYPVEELHFSVTLPGLFTESPTFSSGYHQSSIESSIRYSISGTTISGRVNTVLKDRETLVMALRLPDEMIPRREILASNIDLCYALLGTFSLLMLVYYLLTMRCAPLLAIPRIAPPENTCAGELGTLLVRSSADLSLMVLSWAQMGYLQIRMDRRGRVQLIRQMDMGNERNSFENRCFQQLFGRHSRVDASSSRFARQAEQVAAATPKHRQLLRKGSGNPRLLRLLGAIAGCAAGAAIGDTFSQLTVLRIVWMVLLGALSGLLCWQIQSGIRCLHLRDKFDLLLSLACSAVLLVAGIATGRILIICLVLLVQLLTGLLAFYGGRRTEIGRQAAGEVLGLRRHLRSAKSADLQRIARVNPDYYYSMLPHAMALGLGRRFSAAMGRLPLPYCTWFTAEGDHYRTASEFYTLLEETLYSMNARRRRFPWEKS